MAEAGRRSRLRLRRLESRGLLSCVVVIVDSGGGSTLQVVVVISVPSPVIIKVSR